MCTPASLPSSHSVSLPMRGPERAWLQDCQSVELHACQSAGLLFWTLASLLACLPASLPAASGISQICRSARVPTCHPSSLPCRLLASTACPQGCQSVSLSVGQIAMPPARTPPSLRVCQDARVPACTPSSQPASAPRCKPASVGAYVPACLPACQPACQPATCLRTSRKPAILPASHAFHTEFQENPQDHCTGILHAFDHNSKTFPTYSQ